MRSRPLVGLNGEDLAAHLPHRGAAPLHWGHVGAVSGTVERLFLAMGLGGAVWGSEVVAIEGVLWLPAMLPIAALFLSTVLAYLVRYLVEERRRSI